MNNLQGTGTNFHVFCAAGLVFGRDEELNTVGIGLNVLQTVDWWKCWLLRFDWLVTHF
jgi:hypothetical protein